MLPAQESAISESTHFTGGQVGAFSMLRLCRIYPKALHKISLTICIDVVRKGSPGLCGQVLLPTGPVPKLVCLEHFSGDVMHQATPPAKRPPLPRLSIPGAPCDAHVPSGTVPMVSLCCHPFCILYKP